jgi:hypothetical protein
VHLTPLATPVVSGRERADEILLGAVVEIKQNIKSVETLGAPAVDLAGCRPHLRQRHIFNPRIEAIRGSYLAGHVITGPVNAK